MRLPVQSSLEFQVGKLSPSRIIRSEKVYKIYQNAKYLDVCINLSISIYLSFVDPFDPKGSNGGWFSRRCSRPTLYFCYKSKPIFNTYIFLLLKVTILYLVFLWKTTRNLSINLFIFLRWTSLIDCKIIFYKLFFYKYPFKSSWVVYKNMIKPVKIWLSRFYLSMCSLYIVPTWCYFSIPHHRS